MYFIYFADVVILDLNHEPITKKIFVLRADKL
jgi:hypothetical protein